jgi:two-component system, NarL family, response regulator NreC
LMSSKIRVLIADDHPLIRKSIRDLLSEQSDIEVVATAEDGRQAVDVAQNVVPDVIVMDVFMPEMDGIRATALIMSRVPSAAIIIFSMHVTSGLLKQALHNGAAGYLLKPDGFTEIPEAVRAVSDGHRFFSSTIATHYPEANPG